MRRHIRVDPDGGCWRWTGSLHANGRARLGDRMAARLTYEALRGAVPKRRVLMNTCPHRDCVRPSHLRPTTFAEVGKLWVGKGAVKGQRKCRVCGRLFQAKRQQTLCGDRCRARAQLMKAEPDRGMSGAQADAYLTNCVALENAPAWMRHPIPQTGVRVAGGRR